MEIPVEICIFLFIPYFFFFSFMTKEKKEKNNINSQGKDSENGVMWCHPSSGADGGLTSCRPQRGRS
jgi:hypothetical protein